MEWFTTDELNDLVTPTELLELQDVVRSPAAISVLRKRSEDFPKPRAMSARTPLFLLEDLVKWFAEAREVELQPPGPTWRLEQALKALQAENPLKEARQFAVGVLAACGSPGADLQSLASDHPLGALQEAIRKVKPEEARQALAELLAQVPAEQAGDRFVRALVERLKGGAEPLELEKEILNGLTSVVTPATGTSPDALIDLMLAVGDPDGVDTIFDPTCGEAGLLLAAGAETGWAAELAGKESDPATWRIAQARAHLRGVLVDLGSRPDESRLDDRDLGRDAGLVLCDPPFVGRGYVRWMRHALLNARANVGRAVVCAPGRTLDPKRRESRHIPRGVIEAVVVCPPLRPDTNEPIAIWSLTRADNGTALIVDATGPDAGPAAVRAALREWRSTGLAPTTLPCETRTAEELYRPDGADLGSSGFDSVRRLSTSRRGDPRRRAADLGSELLDLVDRDLQDDITERERKVLEDLVGRLRLGSQSDSSS